MAAAAERRLPSTLCVSSFTTTSAVYSAGVATSAGINPSFTPFLYCPIADDDVFPKTAVALMNIHGFTTTGFVSARACSVRFFAAEEFPTVFCGTAKDTSEHGEFTLSFDTSDLAPAWGPERFHDFRFVEIGFSNASFRNFITGIFLSD